MLFSRKQPMPPEERVHMRLTDKQKDRLRKRFIGHFKKDFPNTKKTEPTSIALVRGCPELCPFCCLDSKKGVRDYMPLEMIDVLAEAIQAAHAIPTFLLHCDGEPLCYPEIVAVVKKLREIAYCEVSSTIPAGTEQRTIELIEIARMQKEGILQHLDGTTADIVTGFSFGISLTDWNNARLRKNEQINGLLNGLFVEKMSIPVFYVLIDREEVRPRFLETRCDRGMRMERLAIAKARELGLENAKPAKYFPESYDAHGPVLPVFGTKKYAFLLGADGSAPGMQEVSNILTFSRLVKNGQLQPGKQFTMAFWMSDYENENRSVYVRTRDWDLTVDRRLAKLGHPLFHHRVDCGGDARMIDGSGVFHTVYRDGTIQRDWHRAIVPF